MQATPAQSMQGKSDSQLSDAIVFRVARNRITDWFRKKRPIALADAVAAGPDGESLPPLPGAF